MVRIPDLVLVTNFGSEMLHIEIASQKLQPLDPWKSPPPDYLNRKVFADIRKAVFPIVGTGVERHVMALLGQCARQRHTLALASTFYEQFVHDKSDIHVSMSLSTK